jgi:hypothetical protein
LRGRQGGQLGDLLVATGQCISDDIERARLVLDDEVKASRPLIRVLVINDNHCGLTFLFEL